jgi:hypothetical protein
VGEPVAVGVLLDHEAGCQRHVHRVEQCAALQAHRGRHQVELEAGARHRRRPQQVGRRGVEAPDPARDEGVDARRDGARPVGARPQQLGDEERVAGRLLHQPDRVGVTPQPGRQLPDLLLRQPGQR